jgi:hypothetical protein
MPRRRWPVPRQRTATPKNIASFDRWLVEADEFEFEAFLAQTPKEFSRFSFELLRECKARVDARLAAEPETRVFSISDPHVVRLRYWYKIADRFAAEINLRSGKSAKATEDSASLFSHSPDYRAVTIRGKKFTLTAQQASMIEILHEAYKCGNPDVSIADILERLEKNSSRWQDTWKSSLDARKALIRSGKRKGTLRLAL